MSCRINPAVNDLTFTKFQKQFLRGRHSMFMDRSCQTRLSRQTCIKIESFDICLWRITFARQRPTIVDVSSFWFVLLWDIPSRSMACRNRRNINCDKRQRGYRLSCESRVLLCPLSVKSKNTQSRDVVCMWRKETMKTDAAQGKIKYVACLLSHCLIF